MPPSLFVLLHAIKETAKISWPAVQHQRAGTLTVEIGDEKLRSWAQALLHHVDAKLVVSGLEHLNTETRSFVIMSNHQSLYDIPALFAALPLSLRMVAKKELFKTPLWGPAMTAAGFIAIDRKNRKAAFKALKKGGALMKEQGISLFIAPEGTRSADGSVGEFKKGGFVLAQATGAPILPVAISGTMNVLSKGHSQVHRGQTIHVQVLPPTSQPNFKQMDQLIQTVRGQIVAAVSELSSR